MTDSGEVLVYDEPKTLAYTFKNEVSAGEQVPGRVTFTIEPRSATVVKLDSVTKMPSRPIFPAMDNVPMNPRI